MKVLKSKRSDNTIALKIEESHSVIEIAMNSVFKRVVKQVKIPGFRKGKAPRNLYEKHYGQDYLINEAISEALNLAYQSAVQELHLHVVDQPKNIKVSEYKKDEPLVFECEVDVKPEVKLGKYKGLKATQEKTTVAEEDITTQLNRIKESFAEFKATDDAVADENIVKFDMVAKINGEAIKEWTRDNVGLKIGLGHYGEAFDKTLIGSKTGDTKSFSLTYEADDKLELVAGNTVDFDITIKEVQNKQLPELTDELVKEKVKTYDTFDALKSAISEELSQKVKQESEDKLHQSLIELAIENSKMTIHPIMIEREIDNQMSELKNSVKKYGTTIDQYASMMGKTLEGVREEFKQPATVRVKSELVLEAIADNEKIEVSNDDLREHIKTMNWKELQTEEAVNQFLGTQASEGMKYQLRFKKAVDFMIENGKITKK